MTDVIDPSEMVEEVVVFLRNQDVFTTSQRGVITDTDAGSWSSATSHLIDVNNVRNIRSITVDGSSLSFGTDYNVDYTFDDGGTTKCKISLVSAQTGSYSISYDYGSDKIFSDFPRPNLSISSFPRMTVDFVSVDSESGGFGNVIKNTISFSVIVYDAKTSSVRDYIMSVRTKFIENWTDFYYLSGVVRPVGVGPMLKSPKELGKDRIFQQNVDFVSYFKYEKN